MLDLIKEIWQTMRTNKLRTFLTGFSVAWGIFMLILLLSISNGLINGTQEAFSSNDPNRITVWPGLASMPYEGLKEGRSIKLKEKSFGSIKRSKPDQIANVEGEITYNAVVSTARDYLSSSPRGVFPKTFNGRYKLLQGRFINEADIRETRKVIMLHNSSASVLFKDTANVVGQIVNVGDIAFKVVGVFDCWNESPCIPFSTAKALKGYNENIEEMNVYLQNVSTTDESGAVDSLVKVALAKDARFAPDDPSAIYTYDRFASYIQQQTGMSILNYTMWTIGILTLITGIVGVSNIMFVSVKERTHEIGIRRAIGAKPRNILVQIVCESIVLTTAFGYIGIVMGTLATEVVKIVFAGSSFMLNPSVDIKIAVEVTIALIIAGALAGIFPAIKSTKVRPVEALSEE